MKQRRLESAHKAPKSRSCPVSVLRSLWLCVLLMALALLAKSPAGAEPRVQTVRDQSPQQTPSSAHSPSQPAGSVPPITRSDAPLIEKAGHGPYVFVGFMSNGEDGVYFAVSDDGLRWDLMNAGEAVIKPSQPGELMRDPFLQRAPDGFRLVWTSDWKGHDIGFSSSEDLVHWSDHQRLAIFDNEPAAQNLWAPAIYYQAAAKRWLILWSSSVEGRYPDPKTTVNGLDHRIYSCTTRDFKSFTPGKLFFDPGYNVIDATIFRAFGRYYLLFKDERELPPKKQIRIARGNSIEGPWRNVSGAFTETSTSGPSAIHVGDEYLVYYDHYAKPQHYSAVISKDLWHWRDAAPQISFPEGMRHGSFLPITPAEAARLRALKPAPIPVLPVPDSTRTTPVPLE